MITNITNIKEEFFKIFASGDLNTPLSLVTHKGVPFEIPYRYARKSMFDLTEAEKESYPIISIQDFLPTIDAMEKNYVQKRYSGYRDTDNDGVNDTVSFYPEPVLLEYRFEVSVATKDIYQFDAVVAWFMSTFDESNQAYFTINKVPVAGTDDLGDLVKYTIDYQDSPRSDGIFEMTVSYTLKPYVHFKPVVDYTSIEILNLQFEQGTV